MLYSSFSNRLANTIVPIFDAALGPQEYIHLGESDILADVKRNGGISKNLLSRLMGLYYVAALSKPDYIICTCSSIGRSAELAAQLFDGIRIIRIDEPMMRYAAGKYRRIALLATVPTTLQPSCELLQRMASELHREVELTHAVAEGAWEAMNSGEGERYTELLCKAAESLCTNSEAIVLAQASMSAQAARIQQRCGKPVLTSPEICVEYIKNLITV